MDATFTPGQKITIALDQAMHVLAGAAASLENPPLLDNGDDRAELKNLVEVADSVRAIIASYVRCWQRLLEGESEEITWK
jgi:hypothetical protein